MRFRGAAVAHAGDCDSDVDSELKASRASAQSREFAPAASHVALHFASEDSAAAARHPIAQLGFWQADRDPIQQCPAAVHLSLQVSLFALAVKKSEVYARQTTKARDKGTDGIDRVRFDMIC